MSLPKNALPASLRIATRAQLCKLRAVGAVLIVWKPWGILNESGATLFAAPDSEPPLNGAFRA